MRSSRHRRSRSDGGFVFAGGNPEQGGLQATAYNLPKSRLSSVKKAEDYGFDAIAEELSPRSSALREEDSPGPPLSPGGPYAASPQKSPLGPMDASRASVVSLPQNGVGPSPTSSSPSSASTSTSTSASSSTNTSTSSAGFTRSPFGPLAAGDAKPLGPGDGLQPRQPEGSRPPRPNAARHRRIRSEDLVFAEMWNSAEQSDAGGASSSPRHPHGLPRPDSKGLASRAAAKLGFVGAPAGKVDGAGRGAVAQSEGDVSLRIAVGDGDKGSLWGRRNREETKPPDIGALSVSGWRRSPSASPKADNVGHGAGVPGSLQQSETLAAGAKNSPRRSHEGVLPVQDSYAASPNGAALTKVSPPSSQHRLPGHPVMQVAPLEFNGPGLVIPLRSSPFTSPFTSPRHSGLGVSPRVGAAIPSSPGAGSLSGSPHAMAAQAELDRVKLMEIQNMFHMKQSWQSPKTEGRGPFVGQPVRTPNVSDYYRADEPPQATYLPSMACVLRKPFRDIREVYRLAEKELGRGNFGVIRIAERRETGERFACKTITKEKLECWEDVEDVKREVEIMESLKGHPHIISIIESFEDSKEVHLVMELCEGGELFDRILERGYYTERQAAKVCRTMVEVLHFIHSQGIIHRDLKPENVLLISKKSDTRLKVIDFGMAIYVKKGERCRLRAGTPNYIAPEVIAKNYAFEADIWSVGVILYVLLCGLPPFWGDTTEDVFKSVLTQDLDFETDPWPVVSVAAKDLVRRMLTRDYKKRLTPAEILSE